MTRLDKLRKCLSPEELDGFIAACRDRGEPLTAEETRAAQEMRAEWIRTT